MKKKLACVLAAAMLMGVLQVWVCTVTPKVLARSQIFRPSVKPPQLPRSG